MIASFMKPLSSMLGPKKIRLQTELPMVWDSEPAKMFLQIEYGYNFTIYIIRG